MRLAFSALTDSFDLICFYPVILSKELLGSALISICILQFTICIAVVVVSSQDLILLFTYCSMTTMAFVSRPMNLAP
jgi:hypothetical protein